MGDTPFHDDAIYSETTVDWGICVDSSVFQARRAVWKEQPLLTGQCGVDDTRPKRSHLLSMGTWLGSVSSLRFKLLFGGTENMSYLTSKLEGNSSVL